ncbi:translation initiation factor eIF3 subunit [Armillaria novae-zelandiae]|uniref:Eukaryotic translation initiation factor 3 subunit J n=1 Tax=Armillaria novae-zelandiae TaxID=153914 RepID=A0AA39UB85_9AGAR|nr:translation initiation factor eIF3 subunit [Armillaria novae-zelandiae]
MSDWEESDSDTQAKTTGPQAKVPLAKKPTKGKWEGEDEDDDAPVSDWEDSSEEEEEKTPSAPVAPPKKKGTLKAKIAEKEAAKAARKSEDEYDSDSVLDPREKARREKELELNADLNNAAELFGAAALGGTTSKELDSLLSFQPRTKDDFIQLSSRIIEVVIKKHQNKPLYPAFVEHFVREMALPLKDVEVRKAASGLTTLANEKQKEQRDKASGKKKPKATSKPVLGAEKGTSKVDTSIYEEALDDFGSHADDFM